MAALSSFLFVASLAVPSEGLDTVEGKHKIMGVNPKLHNYYEPVAPPQYGGHQFFQCDPLARSGTELVPYESLNDDFCDCSNGADEPGTAACSHFPGAAFYCENKGSVPKLVWASHVGDGVCDCCDGSDEWQLGGCENFCAAEGSKIRQQREADLERIEAGLRQKEEERSHTDEKLAQWKAELEELKAKLPVGRSVFGLSAQKTLQRSAALVWNSRLLATPRKWSLESSNMKSIKDGKLKPRRGRERNAEESDVLSGEVKEADDESEYAQWMEHEEEKDTGEEPKEKTPLQIARLIHFATRPTISRSRWNSMRRTCKPTLGPDYAYFSLANECVEALFEHYNYKICFFGKVTQKEEGRAFSEMRLGEFSSYYTDPAKQDSPTDYSIHVFTNGDWCPGGPARETKVKMRCGATLQLISVKEPSRCKWLSNFVAISAAAAAPQITHASEEL
ncbi:Long-chain-fatty-acid--CoA ligase 3 [Perkinsus olseni]|uniref:Glucosidase 2 subunit beta n=1 Tax=Perkinsus olseni TaxID=32597 RepID=A0A7J6PCB2_PEROL|nr:Long-chain-fatty-acid--CoA ligase 3 [Perkinsus olseni]